MRNRVVRQEHLVEHARQRLEIRHDQLDHVVRFARKRVRLLHVRNLLEQFHELLRIVRRVRGKSYLHECDDPEAERLRREIGVIPRNRSCLLQYGASPRTL